MTGERYTSTENLAACYAIAWGAFVANPFVNLFERNPRLYEPMLQLCPYEVFWGLFIAATGITALFFEFKQNKQGRAALTVSVVFMLFAMLFFIGDASSPAWVLFGLIAVFNFIHWRTLKWKSAKV